MKQEFLPAIGPYVTEQRGESHHSPWRHPIHWLNKEPAHIRYTRALASYALWRDSMPFPFDTEGLTIFGDSGGYTYVTDPEYSADPTAVIRWQLKNCTRGVIFDTPPYKPGSAIQFTGSAAVWFDEHLELTRDNVRRALPFYLEHQRNGGQFKWWGVIQGEEWDQLRRWHDGVVEIYPFRAPGEGWALAPKPSTDLISCTRYLRFAHENKISNIHLLQVTADRVVGLVLALAFRAGTFDLVTYDSASALRCAINRSAIVPDGFGQRYIKQTEALGERTVYEMMAKCPCQACQWYREIADSITNAEVPHYILLHNHLIMVESFELTWAEVRRDPDRVLRWAAGNKYGDVLREWEGSHSVAKRQSRPVSLLDRLSFDPPTIG